MRKEIEIHIDDRGKDLTFLLKEMPAAKLEKWLIRLFLALSKNKEERENHTLLDALYRGDFIELFSCVDFDSIEDLLDELLLCVQRRVDNGLMLLNPQTIDNHIEDVRTLFKLRMEVLRLNLAFLLEEESEEAQAGKTSPKAKNATIFNMKAQT